MQSHSARKVFPYQHSFTCGSDLRQGIDNYAHYYKQKHGNSSLDDQTPDEVYYILPHPFAEAA